MSLYYGNNSNIAKKVKKLYVGVNVEIPTYSTTTVNITSSNIGTYFTKSDTNGGFVGSGSTFQTASSSSATTKTTVLTAKQDFDSISFNYKCEKSTNTSTSYYLSVKHNTTELVKLTTSSSSTLTINNVKTNDTITFTFAIRRSSSSWYANWSGMACVYTTQTGTTQQEVAKRVRKLYVGVEMEVPVYEERIVAITSSNFDEYFYSEYYGFPWNSATSRFQTTTANANDELYVLKDISGLSVTYGVSKGTDTNQGYGLWWGVGDTQLGEITATGSASYDFSASLPQGSMLTFISQLLDDAWYSWYTLSIKELVETGTTTQSVARLVMGSYATGLSKVSGVSNLASTRAYLSAASVGDYALFAGGYSSGTKNTVYSYSSSLTRSTATSLNSARDRMGAASVGDYALFAGGTTTDAYGGGVATVDTYNASLTHSTTTNLAAARMQTGSASTGENAIFYSGTTTSNGESARVDKYDSSLTNTNTQTSNGAAKSGGASINDIMIFIGGYFIHAWNSSLTSVNISGPSIFGGAAAGASNDKYAVFYAYANSYNTYKGMCAFDGSLTLTAMTALSSSITDACGVSTESFAVFAGGRSSSAVNTVYTVDTSLTMSTNANNNLTTAADWLAGTALGEYVLFGGGYGTSAISTVNAYEMSY